MKIAIIILNWNGKNLLNQFLPSIVKNSDDAEIHVADNASTDDSIEFIKANFPTVKIIQNETNAGYAKGYNDALKFVKADIYCLLNSDVEVTPNWLSPITDAFKTEQNTAIIQPKILDFKNKAYFEYAGAAGGYVDKFGYPYCRGRIFDTLEKDELQYKDASIFWASGACFFIRSSVFQNLGGFDTSFFAHMEEIDLCWRAFNHGYEIKFVGSSKVFHVGGATLNATNPQKTYLNFRNSLFTITKNAKGNLFYLLLIRLLLDGLAGIKFLTEFKFKHVVSILKAHLSYYQALPRLLNLRKSLPKRPHYYHKKSIVWAYYIRQIKSFQDL